MPYSGPASAYGVIGKTETAYFKMINEAGGVNGRKINLISLDDGYSPPKTVEQIRRLVEQEQVAFLFNTLGTPPNAAIRQYLNDNKMPQLFVATGAAMFGDPKHFPWTIGYQPNYQTEAKIFGKHILQSKPDAKIGVLYQNDGFGKDYLIGLKEGLGADHAGMVVKEVSYEVSEPTVEFADRHAARRRRRYVCSIAATPKFAAQAIRKTYDLGWTPVRYITDVSLSIAAVHEAGGLREVERTDHRQLRQGPDRSALEGRSRREGIHRPSSTNICRPIDLIDSNAIYGFGAAATMVQVLKQCGDDLSRDNIMKQAANLKDLELPMLLPGIKINTSPDNFSPIRQMQLARFNGESWELFGDLISGLKRTDSALTARAGRERHPSAPRRELAQESHSSKRRKP